MATILTAYAPSRTPASIVLQLYNDGNNYDVSPPILSKSDLLALLLPGPLKELIQRTGSLPDLNFANANGVPEADFVRINVIEGGLNTTIMPPNSSIEVLFVATGLACSIWSVGDGVAVASSTLIELRMVHSNER